MVHFLNRVLYICLLVEGCENLFFPNLFPTTTKTTKASGCVCMQVGGLCSDYTNYLNCMQPCFSQTDPTIVDLQAKVDEHCSGITQKPISSSCSCSATGASCSAYTDYLNCLQPCYSQADAIIVDIQAKVDEYCSGITQKPISSSCFCSATGASCSAYTDYRNCLQPCYSQADAVIVDIQAKVDEYCSGITQKPTAFKNCSLTTMLSWGVVIVLTSVTYFFNKITT